MSLLQIPLPEDFQNSIKFEFYYNTSEKAYYLKVEDKNHKIITSRTGFGSLEEVLTEISAIYKSCIYLKLV